MLLWQKENTQQEKEPRTSTHKPDGMETYLNLDKVKIEKRKTGKQVGQLKSRLVLGCFGGVIRS